MDSLFMEEQPSTTNLPSKVNTAKYNKIPGFIDTLNNAKLEAETQIENLKRLNKIKMNKSNFAINNSNIRKLNILVNKLQNCIDKLDRLAHNFLIDKANRLINETDHLLMVEANKLINESGALKRKTMKYVKRLQSKQSKEKKKSQKKKPQKKRKKSKKVKTKRRRTKRR